MDTHNFAPAVKERTNPITIVAYSFGEIGTQASYSNTQNIILWIVIVHNS